MTEPIEADRDRSPAGTSAEGTEPDFADEHDTTWIGHDEPDDRGETESPQGHSGLEPTDRPN